MSILTHATTSAAISYTVGSDSVTMTFLDGSGRVITYPTSKPRGRYLAGLAARKGSTKKPTTITHATTSAAFSHEVGSDSIRETWLDGSGRVFNYSTSTKRGRYLVGLTARKGFAKSK